MRIHRADQLEIGVAGHGAAHLGTHPTGRPEDDHPHAG
jgi:hypothetical protein